MLDSEPAVAGETSGPITRNPSVMGGRPVFRGTRVAVEVLFDNLADGVSLDEILEGYSTLDCGDVLAVLEMAGTGCSSRPDMTRART